MGMLARKSYAGWSPDADAINGPTDRLLRADNLVVDELGALTLRAGSAKVNGVAFADTDLHSLYTGYVSGTRYRMTGASNAVYANGTSIAAGLAGSGDVAFGSHLGQILFARATAKKKYDGTTVRTWGLAMSGSAPTIANVSADGKTLDSCDIGGTANWAIQEDDGTGKTFATGQDGTANGAIVIHPNATTNRGTLTRTFAAATDYTAYDAGGVGADNDLLSLYVYVTEPGSLLRVTVMVDVNASSVHAFEDDYYAHTFIPGTDEFLSAAPDAIPISLAAQGDDRSDVQAILSAEAVYTARPVARLRDDSPVANAGWSKLSVRRGDMVRVGSTAGKDWKTVIAVRLIVETTLPTAIQFDTIRLSQQLLVGRYKWCYIYVRNASGYTAKSAPSALSAETQIQGGGATVTCSQAADVQVNEIWVYRMGGVLDRFYRVATKTSGVTGAGTVAVSDISLSDVDALVANLPLETDNAVPPDNIIAIEGPLYDRTFVLTSDGVVYPSRKLNPDSYASGQAITVTGLDETPRWMRKAGQALYIGTSKDIYRLDGTGAERPDGSVDFVLAPLSIDHPPINDAVVVDGALLVYFGDDGWRALTGGGSQSLTADTSLLYRGQTRHGRGPIAVTTGRFRAAIAKGQLVCLSPESAETTSTARVLRHVPARGTWYYALYPQAFRSLYREPDGTLLAGDASGFVWQLDTGTDDGGTGIGVVAWTPVDADGQPYMRKDANDLRLRLTTGGATATIAVHLDGSGTVATNGTKTTSQATVGVSLLDLTTAPLGVFTLAQLRITGTFTTFALYDWGLTYRERPASLIGKVPKKSAGAGTEMVLSGLKLYVCTLGSARTITPWFDGVAFGTTYSLTTDASEPETKLIQFAAPQQMTDVAWSSDGAIEAWDWEPTVLYTLPARKKVWENKPLVPSTVRRRFDGLTLQIRTYGAAATVTPVVDGVDGTPVTVTTSDLVGTHITFPAVVGRDLWCRITSATPFTVLDSSVQPNVLETLPALVRGLVQKSQPGGPSESVMSGFRLTLCTLGVARVITPYLDGVASAQTFTITTDATERETHLLTFTDRQTAVDLAFSADGPIEVYAWEPIVLYTLPARLKFWEHKPLQRSEVRRRFDGLSVQIHTHGAAVTVTPVVDGVDLTPQTVTTSDLQAVVVSFAAVVGRDCWCRLTGATAFSVLSVAPNILETLPQLAHGLLPASNYGTPKVKTLSGLEVRLCTLGAAVTLTPYLDGVAQTGLSVVTSATVPEERTIQFTSAKEAVEIALHASGPIELYALTPLVSSVRPLGVKVWDSGPIDLGGRELVWIRRLDLKVRATAALTWTVSMDGQVVTTQTVTVPPGVDTVAWVDLPRGIKGRSARLVVTSPAAFVPYWVRVIERQTGYGTEHTVKTIPVSIRP